MTSDTFAKSQIIHRESHIGHPERSEGSRTLLRI
jgi:hypothetical protein